MLALVVFMIPFCAGDRDTRYEPDPEGGTETILNRLLSAMHRSTPVCWPDPLVRREVILIWLHKRCEHRVQEGPFERSRRKVFRTRIGSVGASYFVDDFVSCWGKRGAYWLLLEPT